MPPSEPENVPRSACVRTEIPGPRSRALAAAEAVHLAPGIQQISTLSGLALSHGEGAVVVDVDGNAFLDFVAGIGVASIGHGHPALAQAVGAQAARLSAGSFPSEPRLELLERIASNAPHPALRKIQLYSGGAEAVESALRLARAYTKKYEVVAFWGGFHGKTGGVLGLLGGPWKHGLGPVQPGQHLAPYADCYRCPFGQTYPGCGLRCVDFLRQLIANSTTGSLAAIIVEPIQGTAGNVIPPPGWLEAVEGVAREHGALFILDEMITGWGRTGRLWATGRHAVSPDIVTFGKGVAAGFPVSGLIAAEHLTAARPWSQPSFSSSSYGGSPLAAAAASAVTRVILEEDLPARAAEVGAVLLDALRTVAARYPFIGEVRGEGLLIGIELVADQETRAPLPRAHCERLFHECLRRGLLTMSYAPRLRINPPLVLTREQALEGAAIFDAACAALLASLSS